MLRISRGPCRAPGRLVVPPSHGTPTSAISSFFGSRSTGSRIKLATSPNRGITMPESGSGNLSAIPDYRRVAQAGEARDAGPSTIPEEESHAHANRREPRQKDAEEERACTP